MRRARRSAAAVGGPTVRKGDDSPDLAPVPFALSRRDHPRSCAPRREFFERAAAAVTREAQRRRARKATAIYARNSADTQPHGARRCSVAQVSHTSCQVCGWQPAQSGSRPDAPSRVVGSATGDCMRRLTPERHVPVVATVRRVGVSRHQVSRRAAAPCNAPVRAPRRRVRAHQRRDRPAWCGRRHQLRRMLQTSEAPEGEAHLPSSRRPPS